MKQMTTHQVNLMDDLSEMGGKVWDRHNMSRTYITNEILNKISSQHGYSSDYNLNDNNNKIFLDNLTGKIMRSYKGGKLTVELDLN